FPVIHCTDPFAADPVPGAIAYYRLHGVPPGEKDVPLSVYRRRLTLPRGKSRSRHPGQPRSVLHVQQHLDVG
ncbi:MAG: hypothetical protein Q9P14_15355, partial [candidate division KSB1 bacterium]|nr:hypothetical protein [candidate division KSB1 bacterium]